jgi:hypothetical protein
MTTKEAAKKVEKYSAEYQDWLKKLQRYHTERFNTNYLQYTAYCQTVGTKSKISDPVAPELTERQIQKLFERDPKFFALGRGLNLPKEITDLMGSTVDYFWNNPDMIQSTGTMRSKLKLGGREFCILGNLGVETYFNNDSNTPDMRVLAVEDVIFNPIKTLKTSPVYYVRSRVDLEYLESHKEITKDGKKTGIFKNIDAIKEQFKEAKSQPDKSSNIVNRSGSNMQDEVGPIELITRWEGRKCFRFIVGLEEPQFIQEYVEDVIGDDPLDFAMDIELPKQPYALSYLDFIRGLTKAKDMFLNQTVDYGAKALNPPLFYDPSIAPVHKATLANAFKLGGLVAVNPQMVDHKIMPPINPVAFDLLNYMQQRSESVSGISAYLGGITNSESDKTQGTKGGIEALMSASASPVKDRQINLEESIIEPVVNKWLKIAGALMTENETRFVLISGQSQKWVEITRGILTGKIRLDDLLIAEMITQEQYEELATAMLLEGKDPQKELVYDVDWLIRVETGSMAEVDQEKEIASFKEWVGFCQQFGVQLDMQKVSDTLAQKARIKEPDQYYIQAPPAMPGMTPGMPGAAPGMPMPPMQAMGNPPVPQGMPAPQPVVQPAIS